MGHLSRTADQEQTFKTLYRSIYPDLLRFVQRRADRDQAEDVVAEAFLVAWRRLDELPRAPEDARAWVFGIARNTLLNERRGRRRREALGVRLADPLATPTGDCDADLVASRIDLAKAWGALPAGHQEVLALAVFEHLQAPQAAAVLDISAVAFRLRLSRARRELRAHLDRLPQELDPVVIGRERTSTP